MKQFLFFISSLLCFLSCKPQMQIEDSTSNYWKQEIPLDTPQVFWKDIMSLAGRFELGLTIAPDGNSLAFGVAHESKTEETCIYLMQYVDGNWTAPDRSFLAKNENTFFPMFDPSGKEFYFAKSSEGQDTDLWRATYSNGKIVNPRPLDSIINSKFREAGHGKAKNGAFYFTSNRDQENPCCGDIYRIVGERGNIEKVKDINTPFDEESLFLSPNEDYMIVQAWKPEYESKHDLYITFRKKDASWTTPQRLNEQINTKEIEQRPFVNSDNESLFFSRMSIGMENDQPVYDSDIYWVSTQSIFHPYPYNTQIESSLNFKEAFQINLPKDVFKDIDDEQLTYQLHLGDGKEIPDWLDFDADQLSLSGIWQFEKEQVFILSAKDKTGNIGTFQFMLEVI